ncbi:hypothetical protein [Thomasclavelia sp.]|uniref:hypothetical protein n=1 Tax=Thomasclavelia sp. TaxID=3025757 RepID=UPI0025E78D0C|nr:hypothetical protein [Thomasclavelia sp.]
MIIFLEEMVKIIILITMLQVIHLLDENKNKIIVVGIISVIINFVMVSLKITDTVIGYILYYPINILVITLLCKEFQKGIFYGICYYFIQPIINIAMLYLNVCLNMQFSQLANYITTLLSAGVLAVVHYIKLVRFRGNLIVLYLINLFALFISMYYGYCLMTDYLMLSEVYYYGFIFIAGWIVLNKLLCRKEIS